jgi:hypothetical protein
LESSKTRAGGEVAPTLQADLSLEDKYRTTCESAQAQILGRYDAKRARHEDSTKAGSFKVIEVIYKEVKRIPAAQVKMISTATLANTGNNYLSWL